MIIIVVIIICKALSPIISIRISVQNQSLSESILMTAKAVYFEKLVLNLKSHTLCAQVRQRMGEKEARWSETRDTHQQMGMSCSPSMALPVRRCCLLLVCFADYLKKILWNPLKPLQKPSTASRLIPPTLMSCDSVSEEERYVDWGVLSIQCLQKFLHCPTLASDNCQ